MKIDGVHHINGRGVVVTTRYVGGDLRIGSVLSRPDGAQWEVKAFERFCTRIGKRFTPGESFGILLGACEHWPRVDDDLEVLK